MDKVRTHRELCAALNTVYTKKNADYGDAFGKSMREYGPVAAIVRMEDKFNRLKNLMLGDHKQEVSDESVTDTLCDLANYCLMTVVELNTQQGKEEGALVHRV